MIKCYIAFTAIWKQMISCFRFIIVTINVVECLRDNFVIMSFPQQSLSEVMKNHNLTLPLKKVTDLLMNIKNHDHIEKCKLINSAQRKKKSRFQFNTFFCALLD